MIRRQLIPQTENFKIYLSLLIILFTANIFSQSEISKQTSGLKVLQSEINNLILDPFFNSSTIALDVYDLTDGVSLSQQNNKLLLHPASNMKIVTSIAGLINLGEYYTFRTDLFHTGVIEGVTLYGDLFVVGGFDPDFTMNDLDSLCSIVKSLGIKHIVGGVYADVTKKDSLYWGKGWMWDDDPAPSAPYLGSLNINDNSIKVFVEGTAVDSPANFILIPETDFVSVENKSKTVSAIHPNRFKINRDWVERNNKIIIDGEVRKASVIDSSDHTEKFNLLYPERYFITLFEEKLVKEGIYIDKEGELKPLPKNSVFINSIFRSIDTVLVDLNKESDNLNAEMIVYAIAYNDSGAPANAEDGLAAIYRLVDSLGLNADHYYFADGSGVSHYNLVSAELIVEMLKYIYYKRSDLFDIFYNSLSIAGIDGTIEKRMWNTSAENNVHAKTGTLRGVSA
ncbi:MAG: D-alanyl-D-alanine carboxypeptidase/D-alanyl-D-alanine-endopeptidase, partial [Ignavibacteria bacterium]|nr:D-alanyl-D-alanine carboxypeptidase/D-alanyl-D-alanine-endopeptidase [Ignavibacteria bacterium]